MKTSILALGLRFSLGLALALGLPLGLGMVHPSTALAGKHKGASTAQANADRSGNRIAIRLVPDPDGGLAPCLDARQRPARDGARLRDCVSKRVVHCDLATSSRG
jgi:hypothetical protein